MTDDTAHSSIDIVALAGEIVSAYVSNNAVSMSDLGGLIASVHATLSALTGAAPVAAEPEPVEKPSAAQIRRSVADDGIVSFLDGKTYKTLKRHLTTHGLDPVSYRQRFGLPTDYPMVAPGYAAQRSALAKQIGLGRPGALAEREQKPAAKSGRKAA